MPPPPPPPPPVSGLPAAPTPPQAGSAPSGSLPPPPASEAADAVSSLPQPAGQASQGSARQDSSEAGKDSPHKAASVKEVRAPQPDEDVATVSSLSKSDSTSAPHSTKLQEGLSDFGSETTAHKADSTAKNIFPGAGTAPAAAKDHDAARKFASLDDTYENDSLDYTSVAESTCLESSQAEDTSAMDDTYEDSMADTSCTDGPSMFTEESATEDSRCMTTADDTQEDGDYSSQVDETMDSCLSPRVSDTEDDRSSRLKDSVSDESLNDASQMSVDDHHLSGMPAKGECQKKLGESCLCTSGVVNLVTDG